MLQAIRWSGHPDANLLCYRTKLVSDFDTKVIAFCLSFGNSEDENNPLP
jgi:hypothetical protein